MTDPLDPSPIETPASIGPFRVVRSIGTGSTGTVFLGERSEHFTQRVAIKTLHPRYFTNAIEASLEHEQQVLMRLNHPNIVRLLDFGVTAASTQFQPLHYLVMEYVEGHAIDVHCDLHRLNIRQRVELLAQAMDAVEYAHQRLVVHTDLKPAHVLISSESQVKLLDFGVATMLANPLGAAQPAPFTPAFASPEQRRGEPITVAADVYALGIITSLVLAGIPPTVALVSQELARADDAARQRIAQARNTTATALITELRGDLDAIIAKATQPSIEDRYTSIAALAGDLRRYLDGLPITARNASPIDLTRKWIARHRLAAALAFISIALILLSAAGVAWQTAHATRERQRAEMRLRELVRLTGTLEGELYESVDPLAHSSTAKDQLLQGATQTLDTLAHENRGDPVLDIELAQQYEKLAQLRMVHDQHSPQARVDLEKGIAILHDVASTDSQFAAAQKQMAELEAMRTRLTQ